MFSEVCARIILVMFNLSLPCSIQLELGIGLSHAPWLHQLELFFPMGYIDKEQCAALDLICLAQNPHREIVRAWAGVDVYTEAGFWGNPLPCWNQALHITAEKLANAL